MVIASELKAGAVLRIEGQIYKVLEAEFRAGTAKLGGVVKTKLCNVASRRFWEPHFRPEERLEDVEVEQQRMEFLFATEDNFTFMNPANFEQVEVPAALLGPAGSFLQSGSELPVEFFEGRPISVSVPEIMEARVADTQPATHSQQDSAWKEAMLENGLRIRVPLFIGPGEVVRVEVSTGRYVERVRWERKRSA